MGPLNLALLVAGIALIAVGYTRAKRPWARYQDLKTQEANVARYDSWRGGVRNRADQGVSGASVAMDLFRRQARMWAGLAIVGFVVVLAAFSIR